MKIVPLKAEAREGKGKSIAKKLRNEGKLPAVLYGKKIETLPLSVDLKELKSVIRTEAGTNVILNLEIDGLGKKRSETAIIQEVQRDPIKGDYLHVDFHKIAMDEKIQATVPITLIGESPGVKAGGVLQHGVWEIQIECLPADLPEHLEVDISNLEIGDSIKVGDLTQLDRVEIVTPPDEVLATIVAPSKVEIPLEVAEVAEPEVVGAEGKEEVQEKPEKGEGKEQS